MPKINVLKKTAIFFGVASVAVVIGIAIAGVTLVQRIANPQGRSFTSTSCAAVGGTIVNTIGGEQAKVSGEVLGSVVGLKCPCVCVKQKSAEPVYCTQDAKQCPDGSYVGRTGPRCEFALCPSDSILDDSDVVCPQDVKLCPGGGSVGRVRPSCDFAVCPVDVQAEQLSWSACTRDTDCTLVFGLHDYCRNDSCPSYAINKRNTIAYEAASAAAVKAIYPSLEVRPPCLPVMPPPPEECQAKIKTRCLGGVCRATASK